MLSLSQIPITIQKEDYSTKTYNTLKLLGFYLSISEHLNIHSNLLSLYIIFYSNFKEIEHKLKSNYFQGITIQ